MASIDTLELSAAEIAEMTKWPDPMIESYLNMNENIIILANSFMQVGTGSPEGLITSNLSRQYYDTVGVKLYVNPSTDSKTGWVGL